MLSTNRLLVNKQDTLRGFIEVVLTLAVNHFSLYNGFLVPTPRPLSYRSFYNLLRFSSLGIVSINGMPGQGAEHNAARQTAFHSKANKPPIFTETQLVGMAKEYMEQLTSQVQAGKSERLLSHLEVNHEEIS